MSDPDLSKLLVLQTEHAWTLCVQFDLDHRKWVRGGKISLSVPATGMAELIEIVKKIDNLKKAIQNILVYQWL